MKSFLLHWKNVYVNTEKALGPAYIEKNWSREEESLVHPSYNPGPVNLQNVANRLHEKQKLAQLEWWPVYWG